MTRYWTGKWVQSFLKVRLKNVAETTNIPYKGYSNKTYISTPEHRFVQICVFRGHNYLLIMTKKTFKICYSRAGT